MTTLTYRGIQFEAQSTAVDTAELGTCGTYRGSKTTFSRSAIAHKTGSQLRFLGKSYTA
ncbi:MAG: DUF4278 domain-containing protein [Cyanobacteria bacterium P01_A01_bin.135]